MSHEQPRLGLGLQDETCCSRNEREATYSEQTEMGSGLKGGIEGHVRCQGI